MMYKYSIFIISRKFNIYQENLTKILTKVDLYVFNYCHIKIKHIIMFDLYRSNLMIIVDLVS
jgi:hypothetical protein